MQRTNRRIKQVGKLKIYTCFLPRLDIIAVCLGVLFFASLNSFAGAPDGLEKFDYCHNADLCETAEGYVFRYNQTTAYPFKWDSRKISHPEKYLYCQSYIGKKIKNIHTDLLVFRYTTRLYPVDPATKLLKNKFKVKYTDTSFSTVPAAPRSSISIDVDYNWPYFVLSKEAPSQSSYDIWLSKVTCDENGISAVVSSKSRIMDELYLDRRIAANDFFGVNEHEIVLDLKNRVMVYSRNGYKALYRLRNNFPRMDYYSFRTIFFPERKNSKKVIALEEEISPVSIVAGTGGHVSGNAADSSPGIDFYKKRLEEDRNDIDAAYMMGRCHYDGIGADKDYYKAVKWFYKAACKKHVFAQYYLGLCYYFGHGLEQDDKKAMTWLGRASEYFYSDALVLETYCMLKNADAGKDFNLGRRLLNHLVPARYQGNANAFFLNAIFEQKNKRNMTPGIKFSGGFQAAAERNHPKALYYCGMESGESSQRVKYLRKSAEFGYVPALIELGNAYREGRGIGKSDQDAFRCYKEAADSGSAEAEYFLALCYYLGRGVNPDRTKALSLFGEAAENGVPKAMIALALVGGKNPDDSAEDFFNGREKEAVVRWLKINSPTMKFCVALAMKYGIGCEKAQSSYAFNQMLGSLAGSPYALFEAAKAYENGEGTAPNRRKAIELYEQAARAGVTAAMLSLGRLLSAGNSKQSIEWLRRASEKGNSEASYQLGMIYLKDGRAEMAFKAFKTAAEKEHVKALYMLGDCCCKGVGVEKNEKLAGENWKKYEKALYREENNSLEGPWWGSLPTYPIEQKTVNARLPKEIKGEDANEFIKKYLDKY